MSYASSTFSGREAIKKHRRFQSLSVTQSLHPQLAKAQLCTSCKLCNCRSRRSLRSYINAMRVPSHAGHARQTTYANTENAIILASKINMTSRSFQSQKNIRILGTRILRKVLEVRKVWRESLKILPFPALNDYVHQ